MGVYHFPRLKSVLKDLPFLILAAILARIGKDIVLSFFDLRFNPLTDEFDSVKLAVNWGLLALIFFTIVFLRYRTKRQRKG